MNSIYHDLNLKEQSQAVDLINTLYELSTLGFFIYNLEGDLVSCNQKACELHGWTKEQMLNMRPEEFIHPDGFQTFLDYQKDLKAKGEYQGFSVGRKADGGKFHVEVHGKLINIGKQKYLYSTIRDITSERKNLEKEIRKSKLELMGEHSTQLLHDLLNPLQVITFSISMIENKLTKAEREKVEPSLERIRMSYHKISDMALNTKKSFDIGFDTEKEDIHLVKILEENIFFFKTMARKLEIDIHLECESDPVILGNAFQIEIVFQNLLKNAIDELKDNCSENKKIVIHVSENDEKIQVLFKDNGRGISAEHQEKIWERFYSTKKDRGGSGIGLSQVKAIIESHNGSISYKRENECSVFQVLFPKKN